MEATFRAGETHPFLSLNAGFRALRLELSNPPSDLIQGVNQGIEIAVIAMTRDIWFVAFALWSCFS